MSKPFRGVINLDVRDSGPDWAPYEQPKAPEGAPNVPTLERLAESGLRYSQFHTAAICSPTRAAMLTGA